MKKLTFLIFLLPFVNMLRANVSLPAVMGSNMVLQQQSTAKIWGWGNPLEKVFVTTSWDGKTDSVIVDPLATWQVKVQTPAASNTPYTITIKATNTVVLENILIGEVWVCSGQSNMEMNYTWGLPDVQQELPTAYNTNIRFFTVGKASSVYPQLDCKGQWAVCDSNSVKTFSAAGYFFGKKLNKNLNIPIGLINTSWGATSAEVWTPDSVVKSVDVLEKAAAKLQTNPYCPITPGSVYNTMIVPILNVNIAGAIWYQGETNTGTAATYAQLLDSMISAWRGLWHKNLPFYLVQIAPFNYGNSYVAPALREQQVKVMAYPNTGMIVTSDLVTNVADIHPKDKHDVGYRLADWALAETYHQTGLTYKSPLYKAMMVDKEKAVITFDNDGGGLTAKDKPVTDIFVAGDDKVFYPADAKVEGSKLVVWSKQVKQPVAVRYNFSNAGLTTLFSKNGLPVCPFRTDDWSLDAPPVAQGK